MLDLAHLQDFFWDEAGQLHRPHQRSRANEPRMPAKPLSMADIPDMDDDVDIGGLPSWSSKPKAAAAKPAPAPASKPASYYAAQAEDNSAKGSRHGSGAYSDGSKYTPKPAETSSKNTPKVHIHVTTRFVSAQSPTA